MKPIVTASDVHTLLRDLNENERQKSATFHVDLIAEQVQVDVDLLKKHLDTLQALGMIYFDSNDHSVFWLTESGKLARLP